MFKQKRHIDEMVYYSCTIFLIEILAAIVTLFRTDISEIAYAILITAFGIVLIVETINCASVIVDTHIKGKLSNGTRRLYFLTFVLTIMCNVIIAICLLI